ncbi:efflux RND transporter periplasmic adaptor subunit [Oceanobacter kriegii]|uniref:efflux RND transporter periplasmic adaptor subunit n=1 Tax=Oceanobacter kriegii TaxID=64972 RepID=UPI0009FEB687|nr:efflux RND transporter periplasmic adaptor subunit [Oceanobacter kriegii]
MKRPFNILPPGHAARQYAVTALMIFASIGPAGATAAAEETTKSPATLTVTITSPTTASWPEEVFAYGSIAARETISVSANIGGYPLTDILVDVGDEVSKGQLLARFDSALLLAEQAELAAKTELAMANRDRAVRLHTRQSISEQDLLTATTDAKVAQALLAKNQLHLDHTQVIAVEDGIISARAATLGATVPVGQELFRIIKHGKLEWRGELNAKQLSEIQSGQSVNLQLPDGAKAKAVVRRLSPTLNPQSRLAMVYADLSPHSSAKAGMYASGSIYTGASNILAIPSRSVVLRDGHSYVPTVNGELEFAEVSMKRISTGRRHGDLIEARSGLSPEDIVVVDGAGFLSDGDIVRIVQPPMTADMTSEEAQ